MIPYPVKPVEMKNSQHAHQFHHGGNNKDDSNNFSACHNCTIFACSAELPALFRLQNCSKITVVARFWDILHGFVTNGMKLGLIEQNVTNG
jgi:hypothetical protein